MLISKLFHRFFSRYMMAGSILLSAYLLFQIQPLIAKYILPWFGGSAAVWTICMLFFQFVLLLGYGYSHFLVEHIKPKFQATLHSTVLLLALFFLPISPEDYLGSDLNSYPIVAILIILTMTIGIPYFILTTTSSLIQSWYARLNPSLSPYPLYALSNVGSIFALLSYPILIETNFILSDQATYWSGGVTLLLLMLVSISVYFAWVSKGLEAEVIKHEVENETVKENRFMWFILAATASILLLAVSDHLSRDVASVPFIWVLPLLLYLLSFILTFESDRWYSRKVFSALFIIFLLFTVVDNFKLIKFSYIEQIILYNGILFAACMICHGELVKHKPAARKLTKFYLIIACGGVVGGLYVGVIAPMLFSMPIELFVGLILVLFIFSYVLFTDDKSRMFAGRTPWVWRAFAVIIGITVASVFVKYVYDLDNVIDHKRNFYGSLRVRERQTDNGQTIRLLVHGTTNHGMEILDENENKLSALSYYGQKSGLGQALNLIKDRTIKMGMIGLGVGTSAAYLRTGDQLTVYEINPQVTEIAYRYFRYLNKTKAAVEILHGDGRLLLARSLPQNFDILAIDAFSGDAIPIHLITTEAMESYSNHLSSNGILAIHTSNNYLELRPVIYGIANELGFSVLEVQNDEDKSQYITASQWFLLSRNVDVSERMKNFEDTVIRPDNLEEIIWTDDFSNLFSILK